jgi:murein DD-endopeptidase MepM/ murein hydrolase activator NlpD
VKVPEKKVVKAAPITKSTTSTSPTKTTSASKEADDEKPVSKTTFINPIPGGVLTQRIHDGNAVDFGAPIGTPVLASAAGTVLIAKGSGYNGGYGNYIVINHSNGSQTLYGHLSQVSVSVGETVSQGQKIGLSGNSGKSTGPHLHYKESNTGARNTFVNLPLH